MEKIKKHLKSYLKKYKMSKFVVELERNVWIAPWNGDPGRTLVKGNAKIFNKQSLAIKTIESARSFAGRDFNKAKVLEL